MRLPTRILLALGGLVVALLLVEGLFRIAASLGGSPRPAASSGKLRILCVGDSSTKGTRSSDPERFGYPARLQALLEEREPERFEVVNLGIPGVNSSQLANRIDRMLDAHRPDLVIAMVGVNDSWNFRETNVIRHHRGGSLVLARAGAWLDEHVRVYRFARLAYLSIRFPDGVRTPAWSAESRARSLATLGDGDARARALLRSIEENLRRIIRSVRAHGAVIVLMTYPADGWGEGARIANTLSPRLDVPLVDHVPSFRAAERSGIRVRSADGFHPNDAGYGLMAETVLGKLEEMGVCGPRPRSGRRSPRALPRPPPARGPPPEHP